MAATGYAQEDARYRFTSRWNVPQSPDRCAELLAEALDAGGSLSWWRGVDIAREPDAGAPPHPTRPHGAVVPGDRLIMRVRSPLGYRLTVHLTVTEADLPRLLVAAGTGDLRGRGSVEIDPADGGSQVTWRWQVTPARPWMRAIGIILRPAFAAAHAAVMRRGERGLRAIATTATP